MITHNTTFNNIRLGKLTRIAGIYTNYAIIEIEKTQERNNTYTSNTIVLNELQFFDKTDQLLPFSTTSIDAYDSVSTGVPTYWNHGSGIWNRTNLNDGEILYSDVNSTVFLGAGMSPSNGVGWARFLVQFDSNVDITKADFYTSSNLNRDIHMFRLYTPTPNTTYNKTEMLNNRNNNGLELSWEAINDLSTTGDGVRFSKTF